MQMKLKHGGIISSVGITLIAFIIVAGFGSGNADEPGYIHSSVTGDDRDLMIDYMWDLEPDFRENVLIIMEDGRLIANRPELLNGAIRYEWDAEEEALVDDLGTEFIVPAGSISRVEIGYPDDPDSGVIGGGTGGSTGSTTGSSNGGTGSTSGTTGETGGLTTGGTTTSGSTGTTGTTGTTSTTGSTGETTGGATGGGTTGGEPEPEDPCRCSDGTPAIDEKGYETHYDSGPYRRTRTKATSQIRKIGGNVYLPWRDQSITDIEERAIAPNSKFDRAADESGGPYSDRPYIYFGAKTRTGNNDIDVGLQFSTSDKYGVFVHSPFNFAYRLDEIQFSVNQTMYMSIESVHSGGTRGLIATFDGLRWVDGGTPYSFRYTICLQKPDSTYTHDGTDVTLGRVVSIAQSADSELVDSPNAGSWFCGIIYSDWVVTINGQENVPFAFSHVSTISSYPRAKLINGVYEVFTVPPTDPPSDPPIRDDAKWTAPMIYVDPCSVLSLWTPANETVSIDLRHYVEPSGGGSE